MTFKWNMFHLRSYNPFLLSILFLLHFDYSRTMCSFGVTTIIYTTVFHSMCFFVSCVQLCCAPFHSRHFCLRKFNCILSVRVCVCMYVRACVLFFCSKMFPSLALFAWNENEELGVNTSRLRYFLPMFNLMHSFSLLHNGYCK